MDIIDLALTKKILGGADGGGGLPTQKKTITITENGTVEVLPDEGYTLDKVTANVAVYDAVDDRFAKWIEGDMTTLYDPNATSVCDRFASHGMHNYTTVVTFTMETLTSIDLPNATSVGEKAFVACKQLKSVNLPSVRTMGAYAFYNCTSLEGDLYFPNLTTAEMNSSNYGNTFGNCASIKSFTAPVLSELAYGMFKGCSALETVILPSITKISNSNYTNIFEDCTSLKRTDFRNVEVVTYSCFSGCSSLKILDVKSITTTTRMSLPVESYKTAFRVISMRTTTQKGLSQVPSTGVFAEGGAGGYIIVPSALIESYQSATNWSALVAAGLCTFLATEDYTIDGTTTGELDWDKVEALIGDESGGTEV